ncbi:murein biosynthesis integral membrane protein MurJ [Streptomyces sp. CA-111067]|uniref:murein biosynthesis integral membrane protein MurJ n=1 Tax=Streptomyces sp. CA-111067 TaxID=3240046 RepID=UPI003D951EB1
MPPSPEQRPAAPDPYLQNTYTHDPYRQQDASAQDPVDEALYDGAAHPPPAYGQEYPQASYPQQPYQGSQAPQYAQEQPQEYDAFEHLFRDQRPGAQPYQPPPQQDAGQQHYQQPYPQQQGQGPGQQHGHQEQHGQHGQGYGYPQQGQQPQAYGYPQPQQGQQPYQQQGGYPQQDAGYQQQGSGYPQQADYQQQAAYPSAYPQTPPDNEGTGYSEPVYEQQPPYGQAGYQDPQQYADTGYADPNYTNPGYVDPRYTDPRYAYPYQPRVEPQYPMVPGAESPDSTGTMPVIVMPPPAGATAVGGKAAGKGGILASSALMAVGTLASRVTGFVRTLVIAAAIGVATLGDSYAVANTLPTMIYILTIGGGLNSVFVPQLVRAMKDDDDGGTAYANRLLTVVMVVLGGIVAVTVLAAPLLIRLMSAKIADNPDTYDVAIAFARYCLPTIFFMGVHVVMGQVLNARGRFGAMMWTPVLNNIVVIFTFGMFIWVYGPSSSTRMDATTITPEGVRLLGLGTLLGLVVQSLAMLPYLRDAGFKFRPRFDWRGHGLGKAAKLAKWTFFFVLANQAGLIVVTQLATWAGANADKSGFQGTGITAYNNALLIWQMPQAIITVSVMAAVLPRISRSAADGDITAVRDDISYGLRTSAVAIVPGAFAFLALGVPMCSVLYASTGGDSARNIGFILMAFGLGLIPFSVQYVILRGFYAFEDTRTPFYNTVIVAAVNALASAICFVALPSRWAVVGMAFSYGLAYAVGVGVAAKRLRSRLRGDLDGRRVVRTYARLVGACIPAAGVAGLAVYLVTGALGSGAVGSLAALVVGGGLLVGLFLLAAKRMRIEELNGMIGMVRGRLGR